LSSSDGSKNSVNTLKTGLDFEIGFHEFIAYDDGRMAIRLQSSLMSPDFKINKTGLRQPLKWLDKNALSAKR
jgi:hypothetical protein